MESETLSNLIQGTVALVMGVVCITVAIAYSVSHCYCIGAACLAAALFCFADNEYGYESVIAYFSRKIKR